MCPPQQRRKKKRAMTTRHCQKLPTISVKLPSVAHGVTCDIVTVVTVVTRRRRKSPCLRPDTWRLARLCVRALSIAKRQEFKDLTVEEQRHHSTSQCRRCVVPEEYAAHALHKCVSRTSPAVPCFSLKSRSSEAADPSQIELFDGFRSQELQVAANLKKTGDNLSSQGP